MNKRLDEEMDRTWRTKGHAHDLRNPAPRVCFFCGGKGTVTFVNIPTGEVHTDLCSQCCGTGELYD